MLADVLVLILAAVAFVVTFPQQMTTKDRKGATPAPVLILVVVIVLLLDVIEVPVPIPVLWTAMGLVAVGLVGFYWWPRWPGRARLEQEIADEREFYLENAENRLKVSLLRQIDTGGDELSPDQLQTALSSVLAGREEIYGVAFDNLYQELTAVDRKLGFNLGIAGGIITVHALLLRATLPGPPTGPGNGPTGVPPEAVFAMIVTFLGMLIATFAALMTIRPRGFWMGEEAIKASGCHERRLKGLLEGIITERRRRDRTYTTVKVMLFVSAFALLLSHSTLALQALMNL